MSHTAKLNERLRRIQIAPVPFPWQQTPTHAIGGIIAVGYATNSDLLLVVTYTGRGLFDCITGQQVARDRTPPEEGDWYDETGLLAKGIGSVEQNPICLAGLNGGGLRLTTRDGWSLESVAPDWPLQSIILQPPGRNILVEKLSDGCVKLEEDYEFRAFGFSDTARSFVVALSHSLIIYSRQ